MRIWCNVDLKGALFPNLASSSATRLMLSKAAVWGVVICLRLAPENSNHQWKPSAALTQLHYFQPEH